MIKKISGVYKITNTITNDFYIGSSKDIKRRWSNHKCPSRWKQCKNNPLYKDFQKFRVDKFELQVLAEVEPGSLKEMEQQFIEKLQPTYNNYYAKGLDIERIKETKKKAIRKYRQTEKGKEYNKEYNKEYRNAHKEEVKEYNKEYQKEYQNQLCFYNGEVLTLCALSKRFSRAGIDHPTQEAKKYLLK